MLGRDSPEGPLRDAGLGATASRVKSCRRICLVNYYLGQVKIGHGDNPVNFDQLQLRDLHHLPKI